MANGMHFNTPDEIESTFNLVLGRYADERPRQRLQDAYWLGKEFPNDPYSMQDLQRDTHAMGGILSRTIGRRETPDIEDDVRYVFLLGRMYQPTLTKV